MSTPPRPRPTGYGVLAAGAAIALTYLVLALPASPEAPGEYAGLPLPLEVVVIVFAVLAAPARVAAHVRRLATVAVGALLLFKLVDLGTHAAVGRAFNPALDARLPGFGWNVLAHALGFIPASLLVAGVLLGLGGLLWLIAHGFYALRHAPRRPRRWLAGVSAVALAASAVLSTSATLADSVSLGNTRLLFQRVVETERALQRLADFETRLAAPASPHPGSASHFERLAGKDVLIVFVESYGRTVFEREHYARVVGPRLTDFERRLETAGFTARSGWLTSPTVGGQSWLAHGTLLSGLWLDNQPRYDRVVTSSHLSLNRRFGQAGWRTVAVMPAITRAWPAGDWFGYDTIYASGDLGYAGDPFNWVTMPDQYTLSALEHRELSRADGPPVMAEVALISSHAPWTPIPPLLDWAAIGDGRIFKRYAHRGDPPSVVWQDPDRVRTQYVKSIDYSLETLASFIATYGRDDQVFIILGDHQPAPLVTGDNATRDVPVHVIAADPAVLDAIDDWGWTPGLTPDAETPAWPMDAFYDRFLTAFGD